MEQARTNNKVNEITNITETNPGAGAAWFTPAYDAAGNTTEFPSPSGDPTN